MEEKIDSFGFGNRFVRGELDRIDAVERLVRARAQQQLQPRDDARGPGFGRFKRDQSLFESFFVDHRITPRKNPDYPRRPSDLNTQFMSSGRAHRGGISAGRGLAAEDDRLSVRKHHNKRASALDGPVLDGTGSVAAGAA